MEQIDVKRSWVGLWIGFARIDECMLEQSGFKIKYLDTSGTLFDFK